MVNFETFAPPTEGEPIRWEDGELKVPDQPVIPFIEGDGIGPDIWKATRRVVDAAVDKTYQGERQIAWYEVYAGEKANETYGEWLPADTLTAFHSYHVGIKGPLTTPIGGGFRSLNVAIRQRLDLYACVRPVRWLKGTPSPMADPSNVDFVVFRENTEDIYAGIEWPSGSDEAERFIEFMKSEYDVDIRADSGIGVKPVSIEGSKRLIRAAIQYAIDHDRATVALMHKGNIMKYTEGLFKDVGYKLAKEEFAGQVITEDELWDKYDGQRPEGKVVLKDRIADIMFQQVLLRPAEYDVIAAPNLNGDYLSDALAAQAGGVGMAPGGNIGDGVAVFEATHGTAPKYANQNKVNPSSLLLSACMMLEHLGWVEAADRIEAAIEAAIEQKTVTYDLARGMDNATKVGTAEFATAVIENL